MSARGPIVEPAPVSGNGLVTQLRRRKDTWLIEFMSEPRTSPEPLWFHLQCRELGGRKARFVWLNAGGCLGLGGRRQLEAVRPVVRLDGGPWQRVERVTVGTRRLCGHTLTFETPALCGRADAAFCYPYGPDDLDRTLGEVEDVWKRQLIGVSGHSRPLCRLRAAAPPGRGSRPGAYVIARQHAGETPGSWVLDGLLRAVARARPVSRLRRVEWWAVPFVDLDGVVEGDYGKDALPWDFNRAWAHMPMRPEVLSIQRDMHRFAKRARPRLLLDLHAPGGGERSFYQFLCRDDRPTAQKSVERTFMPCLAAEFAEIPRDRLFRVPRYPSRWNIADTATTWAWEGLDRTLGVGLETPYQAIGDGDWLQPHDYADIGRRVARAVSRWLTSR